MLKRLVLITLITGEKASSCYFTAAVLFAENLKLCEEYSLL